MEESQKLNPDQATVYIDLKDALTPDRLKSIDLGGLLIAKPTGYSSLLALVAGTSESAPGSLFIMDGIEVLDEFREGYTDDVVKNLLRHGQNLTLIASQSRGHRSDCWGFSVTMETEGLVKLEGDEEFYGHLAKLSGPEGKSTVLVTYKPGRISKGYELALSIKEGGRVPPQGVFEHNGISARGFWNFVREIDSRA